MQTKFHCLTVLLSTTYCLANQNFVHLFHVLKLFRSNYTVYESIPRARDTIFIDTYIIFKFEHYNNVEMMLSSANQYRE